MRRRESFFLFPRRFFFLYVLYTYTLNKPVFRGSHCFPFNSQEEYLQRVRVIDLCQTLNNNSSEKREREKTHANIHKHARRRRLDEREREREKHKRKMSRQRVLRSIQNAFASSSSSSSSLSRQQQLFISKTSKRSYAGSGPPGGYFSEGTQTHKNGYLFGETPPKEGARRVRESWELPYFLTFSLAGVMLYFGLNSKPNTSLVDWAREEAQKRLDEEK